MRKRNSIKLLPVLALLLISGCRTELSSSEKSISEGTSISSEIVSSETTSVTTSSEEGSATSEKSSSENGEESSITTSSEDSSSIASSEESSVSVSSEPGVPYNVTFVTNCETMLDAIYTDVIYDMPLIFREGYTLAGWYLEATFINIVSFPYYVTSDVTLYAKWTEGETAHFTFELHPNNNGYIVTSYGGNAINVVVPTTYNDKPIVALGEKLFYQNGSIKSVVLPATLTYIGMQAFKDAVSLESIVIPSNVTELATDAFAGTISLAQVTLSSKLKIIGNNAFENSAFAEVTIPSLVTEISSRAFAGNTNLLSVNLISTTPPLRFANSFEGTVSTMKYYVPSSAYNSYINSPYWQAYSAQIVVK